MKKYFVLIGLFLGCLMLASGYPRTIETQILPSATSGWDESIDNWRPIAVDSNGKLITGGPDSANIASMSDALSNPLEWKVSVASVTSTISTFTSQLTSDTRRFVAIKNRDAFKPIYLGFDNAVTVETGLPINDTLYIEVPKAVPLYLISAEEVGVVMLEAGR